MDSNSITYEQVLNLFAETSRRFEETRMQFAETSRQLEETSRQSAETDKQIKNLAKQVADVTDTLGRFAEEQVRPRILALFREKGIDLEETHQRIRVEKDGKYLLEIDLLLVNTIYSVVVEVKNTLRQNDIDEHIERLEKLQETPSRSIKGTTMYGAVAGMIVTEEVEKYAIKKGLYVIKPKGDGVEISNSANFMPKTWQIRQ